jgi:hypothetical protein
MGMGGREANNASPTHSAHIGGGGSGGIGVAGVSILTTVFTSSVAPDVARVVTAAPEASTIDDAPADSAATFGRQEFTPTDVFALKRRDLAEDQAQEH